MSIEASRRNLRS